MRGPGGEQEIRTARPSSKSPTKACLVPACSTLASSLLVACAEPSASLRFLVEGARTALRPVSLPRLRWRVCKAVSRINAGEESARSRGGACLELAGPLLSQGVLLGGGGQLVRIRGVRVAHEGRMLGECAQQLVVLGRHDRVLRDAVMAGLGAARRHEVSMRQACGAGEGSMLTAGSASAVPP